MTTESRHIEIPHGWTNTSINIQQNTTNNCWIRQLVQTISMFAQLSKQSYCLQRQWVTDSCVPTGSNKVQLRYASSVVHQNGDNCNKNKLLEAALCKNDWSCKPWWWQRTSVKIKQNNCCIQSYWHRVQKSTDADVLRCQETWWWHWSWQLTTV